MFRFGYESDLFDRPVKYGMHFDRVPRVYVEGRTFAPGELRSLIDNARQPIKAMVLLGINCGFGNTDCATLRWADVKAGFIDQPRHKTGAPRRCPLWPETLAALEEVRALKRKPADDRHAGLVFLTKFGAPWQQDYIDLASTSPVLTSADAIANEFLKLTKATGLAGDKRGFYTLRRTFSTWANETGDGDATKRINGHELGTDP